MSETGWHGFGKKGSPVALHIGGLPGRKSVCLYVDYGNWIDTLAFFPSEEKAIKALELIEWLVQP